MAITKIVIVAETEYCKFIETPLGRSISNSYHAVAVKAFPLLILPLTVLVPLVSVSVSTPLALANTSNFTLEGCDTESTEEKMFVFAETDALNTEPRTVAFGCFTTLNGVFVTVVGTGLEEEFATVTEGVLAMLTEGVLVISVGTGFVEELAMLTEGVLVISVGTGSEEEFAILTEDVYIKLPTLFCIYDLYCLLRQYESGWKLNKHLFFRRVSLLLSLAFGITRSLSGSSPFILANSTERKPASAIR